MGRQMLGRIARYYRYTLAEQQGGLCIYCRVELTHHVGTDWLKPTDATLEHLIPVSRGGGDEMTNLAVSCHACNDARQNMPHEKFLRIKRKDLTDVEESKTQAV